MTAIDPRVKPPAGPPRAPGADTTFLRVCPPRESSQGAAAARGPGAQSGSRGRDDLADISGGLWITLCKSGRAGLSTWASAVRRADGAGLVRIPQRRQNTMGCSDKAGSSERTRRSAGRCPPDFCGMWMKRSVQQWVSEAFSASVAGMGRNRTLVAPRRMSNLRQRRR